MDLDKMRPIEILMVEDNATDVLITREALEYAKVLNQLNIVEDGVEALAYLRREGEYKAAIKPDLVLLDLNLPRKDGREVLQEVKADPDLCLIPVVVLTTSKSEEDIIKAYGLHANCYITKPVDFNQFMEVIRAIEQFWFTVVTLPREK
jgi:two-component system response regulator